MDILNETQKLILEEQKLEEMSSIRKRDYNLPVNIWIDDIGSERKTKHNIPRIKVQNDYSDTLNSRNLFSLSIEKNPKILAGEYDGIKSKDIKIIKDFVKLNEESLMKYWNQEIGLRELLSQLKEL